MSAIDLETFSLTEPIVGSIGIRGNKNRSVGHIEAHTFPLAAGVLPRRTPAHARNFLRKWPKLSGALFSNAADA